MTERADPFHDVASNGSIGAPRVPAFEHSELEPVSGRVDSGGTFTGLGLDARGMGTCLVVVADGIVFGSLFGLYALLRSAHPEIFAHGRYFLNPIAGATGNSVLLLGCLTAALAVRFARQRHARGLATSLASTIVLAGFYLGIQGAEFADKFERGLLPGRHFMSTEQVWETDGFRREHPRSAQYAERFRPGDPSKPTERGASLAALAPLIATGALGEHAVFPNAPSEPRNAHEFFGVYFLFAGVLGLHVLGGAAVWAWLLSSARRIRDGSEYAAAVDYAALYWSFIAVVRVLMFPLFYLVR